MLDKLNTRLLQFVAQPAPAVHTDLDREGQPRLQANMHQPELAIDKIEVEVLAVARLGDQFQLFSSGDSGAR